MRQIENSLMRKRLHHLNVISYGNAVTLDIGRLATLLRDGFCVTSIEYYVREVANDLSEL